MVFKDRLHICTVKLYSQSNKVNITNNNDDGNYMNITKLIFDIICTKLTRSVSTEWYFYGHNETLLLPVAGTLGNAKTAWSTLKSTQGGGGRVRGEGGGGGGGHPVEQELSLSFIFLPAWLNQLSLSFLLIFLKTKKRYWDTTFHGRCQLGRRCHNVEILCVCLWQGLDTYICSGRIFRVFFLRTSGSE